MCSNGSIHYWVYRKCLTEYIIKMHIATILENCLLWFGCNSLDHFKVFNHPDYHYLQPFLLSWLEADILPEVKTCCSNICVCSSGTFWCKLVWKVAIFSTDAFNWHWDTIHFNNKTNHKHSLLLYSKATQDLFNALELLCCFNVIAMCLTVTMKHKVTVVYHIYFTWLFFLLRLGSTEEPLQLQSSSINITKWEK